jgi:flavin-dependent dehydrogenase
VLGPSGGRWRPAAALASFRAWLLRRCGFEPGRVTEVRAGLVPVGGAVRAPARAGRVRLAGDAAGHVSALTAGGIGRAAESGRLAVRDLAGEASAAAATRALAARCGGRRALLRAAWQLTRLPGGTEAAVLVARSAWGARAALSVLFSSTPPEEAGAPLAASEPS